MMRFIVAGLVVFLTSVAARADVNPDELPIQYCGNPEPTIRVCLAGEDSFEYLLIDEQGKRRIFLVISHHTSETVGKDTYVAEGDGIKHELVVSTEVSAPEVFTQVGSYLKNAKLIGETSFVIKDFPLQD